MTQSTLIWVRDATRPTAFENCWLTIRSARLGIASRISADAQRQAGNGRLCAGVPGSSRARILAIVAKFSGKAAHRRAASVDSRGSYWSAAAMGSNSRRISARHPCHSTGAVHDLLSRQQSGICDSIERVFPKWDKKVPAIVTCSAAMPMDSKRTTITARRSAWVAWRLRWTHTICGPPMR